MRSNLRELTVRQPELASIHERSLAHSRESRNAPDAYPFYGFEPWGLLKTAADRVGLVAIVGWQRRITPEELHPPLAAIAHIWRRVAPAPSS